MTSSVNSSVTFTSIKGDKCIGIFINCYILSFNVCKLISFIIYIYYIEND